MRDRILAGIALAAVALVVAAAALAQDADEDAEALAGAVRGLVSDAAPAAEMGKKGRAFVEARYDRRKLADAYVDILEKAILEKSGAAG